MRTSFFFNKGYVMKVLMGACGVAMAAMCGVAHAGSDAYVGAALGYGHQNIDCTGTTSCDSGSVGGKVWIGAHATPMLAVEMGYLVFGKAKFDVNGVPGSIKSKAFAVDLAIHGQVAPNLTLIGRVGGANVMAQYADATPYSTSNSSTNPYLGFSVAYTLMPNLKVEGGIDLTRTSIGGQSGGVQLLSAGVSYGF